MRVLWITNIEFPEVTAELLGVNQLKSSGGWMIGSAEALLDNYKEVDLYVASISRHVKGLRRVDGERIKYFLIPFGKGNLHYNAQYERYWHEVSDIIKPDVVHIHGTEYSHGLAYIKACGGNNVVISIQGLTSAYYYYYYYGLSRWDIVRHITLRDIIRGTLFNEKNRFRKRGLYEIQMIKSVKHIIGRTSWDYSRVNAINPSTKYHFCNEILRPEFYEGNKWEYSKCIPHSIFFSQAHYPIKGFHQLLRALPLLIDKFPDVEVFVGGRDITRSQEGIIGNIKLGGYGAIVRSLIKKYQLGKRIHFLGNLDAREMVSQYLRCNVFVCSSTIENSPNSLGEAQILGTPVVASYVGGIPDMMVGDESHLYRFEETTMLADRISDVFSQGDKQICMIQAAKTRHDAIVNASSLYHIYSEMIK